MKGKRIQLVLAKVDEEDVMKTLRTWEAHLEKHIIFPFDAEVSENQEKGPLQLGDKVRVKKISFVDDFYGLIVELNHERRKYDFPLCDLEVIAKDSPNYHPVDDYSVWFVNR